MEQELWYRWRELDRVDARALLREQVDGASGPGVVEQARRAVGRALVRVGSLIAAEQIDSSPRTSAG